MSVSDTARLVPAPELAPRLGWSSMTGLEGREGRAEYSCPKEWAPTGVLELGVAKTLDALVGVCVPDACLLAMLDKIG